MCSDSSLDFAEYKVIMKNIHFGQKHQQYAFITLNLHLMIACIPCKQRHGGESVVDGQEEGATEVILCTAESKDLKPRCSTKAGWVIGL